MLAVQPRSASRSSWRRRIWRGRGDHRAPVLPLQVGDDQRRPLEPGHPPQRGHVRLEDEVAVAGVPRRHLEPLHRVHVDVHGQQVVAALGSVLLDLLDEEGRVQAFAHQPALHVGHHQQHRVDRARIRPRCAARQMSRHSPLRSWIGHSYTPGAMDRNRPLIGICAYEVPAAFSHWRDVTSVMVPSGYTRSVHAAGGAAAGAAAVRGQRRAARPARRPGLPAAPTSAPTRTAPRRMRRRRRCGRTATAPRSR